MWKESSRREFLSERLADELVQADDALVEMLEVSDTGDELGAGDGVVAVDVPLAEDVVDEVLGRLDVGGVDVVKEGDNIVQFLFVNEVVRVDVEDAKEEFELFGDGPAGQEGEYLDPLHEGDLLVVGGVEQVEDVTPEQRVVDRQTLRRRVHIILLGDLLVGIQMTKLCIPLL